MGYCQYPFLPPKYPLDKIVKMIDFILLARGGSTRGSRQDSDNPKMILMEALGLVSKEPAK
jgi:hypothetical protein